MNPSADTSTKVIRNTLFSNAGYLWGLLVSLLLTPYIISKIGIAQYGLFVLIEVVFNMISLLDVAGISGSFVKFVSEFNARKEYDRLNRLVVVGMVYYGVFGFIICSAAFLFRHQILSFFPIPSEVYHLALLAFSAIMVISFLQGWLAVFRSVLLGMQRFDITNSISICMSIATAIGMVSLLSAGWGFKGLVTTTITVAMLMQCAQVITALRILPGLRSFSFVFDTQLFMETFRYGMQVQVSRITDVINAQVDKFLIAHFLKVELVGFYDLGAKIANVAKTIPMQLMPAILPAASELDALGNQDRVLNLYYRASKYAALLVFPIVAFVCAHPNAAIYFWIGKTGFGYSALALQVLAVGNVFIVLASAGRLVARGIGIPVYEMWSSIVMTILNVGLSLILLMRIGFAGALIGTAVSASIGSIYFIVAFHRRIKQGIFIGPLVRIYTTPLIAALFAVLISCLPLFVKGYHFYAHGRIQAFGYLTLCGIPFVLCYGGVILGSRYIDKSDWALMQRAFDVFLGLFGHQRTTEKIKKNDNPGGAS